MRHWNLYVGPAGKAWSGKKRIAKKLNPEYFVRSYWKETADYLLTANPGDIIHSCTGFNHPIKELEFTWQVSPKGNTQVIWEVRVTDDTDRRHYFPGGGCVSLPETREEIETYFLGWDCPDGRETMKDWNFNSIPKYIEILRGGGHIVDERGLKLPETIALEQEMENLRNG